MSNAYESGSWAQGELTMHDFSAGRSEGYSSGYTRPHSENISISTSRMDDPPRSYSGDHAYITRQILRDALEDLLIDLLRTSDRLDTWSARRWCRAERRRLLLELLSNAWE